MLSKAKRKGKFRSTFEWTCNELLKKLGVKSPKYENTTLDYKVPMQHRKYTPDFELPNGILLELKGRFTLADRKKMKYVIACNPDKDIRLIFMNPTQKLHRSSKTTYAQWCDKNKLRWGTLEDIKEWVNE